ncbi:acyltransferase [Aquimarina sediminis]|uniref:acyltransferase n=1 Tax=Aquimarina sediminis TaxID=2070536 RepID=UPI000CA04A6F|nr:acyltransferase family protein [Aquimarina sediminis]
MKDKQVWLDNTRAIATIAVVIVHVSAPILYKFGEVSNEIWWVGNVYDSIVRFCVPVFFMLTGALLLSKDYILKDFLIKRFLRIIPPLVFWSLIYICYHTFFVGDNSFTLYEFFRKVIKGLFQGSEYHLWFVYTLLGLYLFIPVLRKWIKYSSRKEVLYFLLIWGVTITYGVPVFRNYLPQITLINFTGFIGYIVLGYYLSNTTMTRLYVPIMLIVVGVAITIYGTYYISDQENLFHEYFYGYLTPNILMVSIGVFLFFKTYIVGNKVVVRIISFISDHSFGIYLVHVLILSLLDKIGVNWELTTPVISIPLVTGICVVLSGTIVYLVRKIKYGRYVSG